MRLIRRAVKLNERTRMPQPKAPETVEEFQKRLMDITEGSPKRLRQCADFVARNTDIIAVSTVADLSRGAGVQPSAFMRFCQSMGFSGFSQMQRIFRETHTQRWPDYATRLQNMAADGEDSPSALLAEFVGAGQKSLENLANTIKPETLEQAVCKVTDARMIHIIGLARAFPVATYLAYAFEKMDVPAMLHGRFGNLDQRHAILPGDTLIAITFAPYSPETLDLAGYAQSLDCSIVAITDAINSPLHQLNVTAMTVSEEDVGSFRALTAPLSLAITLAVAVGARRQQKSR